MNVSYMQCLLGMACNDFCMIASDMTNSHSIFIMRNDEDRIHTISDGLIMAVSGDTGDRGQFSQFVAKNIQLYKIRNKYPLGTAAAVHFTRKNLAEALRSETPYNINLLFGGYDKDGGQLYYMDFLATCLKVPFAVHGLSGTFSMSILDNLYKPSLTEDEAYQVIKTCVYEIHQRFLLNLSNFIVKVVSKNGVNTLPIITPADSVNKLF